MYKTKVLIGIFVTLIGVIILQIAYYQYTYVDDVVSKKEFSALIGLPDHAVATEAHYIRHRSLAAPFAFFSEFPSSLEYFPSTFVYAPSPNVAHMPSRIDNHAY